MSFALTDVGSLGLIELYNFPRIVNEIVCTLKAGRRLWLSMWRIPCDSRMSLWDKTQQQRGEGGEQVYDAMKNVTLGRLHRCAG